MAYNPSVSYHGDRYIAGGLQEIAGMIMQSAERRRQKEEWAKASATLQPLIDKLAPDSGIKIDKDTPKELVPQLIQVAGTLERETREKPLRDLQLENERLRQRISQRELDNAATNAAALGVAGRALTPQVDFPAALTRDAQGKPPPMRPGDPAAALSGYLNTGGTDARMVAELGALAQAALKGQGRTPGGLQSFGTDAWGRPVQGLVDAQGNVARIAPPADAKDAATPFQIGGKTLYRVGSDILDDQGVPVRAPADKPLDPRAAVLIFNSYDAALQEAQLAERDVEGKWFKSGKQEAAQRLKMARAKANLYARQLGYAEPFPGAEPGAEAAPGAPAAPAKPAASPYTAADVQAEMRKRGLIK